MARILEGIGAVQQESGPRGRPAAHVFLDPKEIRDRAAAPAAVGAVSARYRKVRANLEILAPRHEVPAGMTGWWQVKGRSSFAPEEAIRMDLFYIENWPLGLDLFILLKTFGVVAARRAAF